MRVRHALACTLLAGLVLSDPVVPIVLELPIAEFVALQRLSDSERRSRFHLPEWCDPTVAASRSGRTQVTVIIGCVSEDPRNGEDVLPGHTPPVSATGSRRARFTH